METKEMNERLTRVGPGTPMGKLLRYYWWPIAGSAELLENPVKPITLLGENLALFKDRQARIGLIGQRCAHRRFDLQYGIPEQGGLRCPYHGWMYDQTGQCIQQPAEPEDSHFKDRVKIPAYPVQELGGLIFAYLGPQPAPLLPLWDLYAMENSLKTIAWEVVPCNWLQCTENSADPVHTEWLHSHFQRYVLERQGKPVPTGDIAHHLRIGFERHPYGLVKRRFSTGDPEDSSEWKYGHLLIFPDKVRLAGSGTSESYQVRVPMDDERTWHMCYNVSFVPGAQVPEQDVIPVYRGPMYAEDGSLIMDYTLGQDMLGWWSQGKIVDRTQEKLGQSDKGVILFRKMLKEQMEIVEAGGEPTINVFRDPIENEYLDTNLFHEDSRRPNRRGGEIGMAGSGGVGRFNPYREEMNAILREAAAAAR